MLILAAAMNHKLFEHFEFTVPRKYKKMMYYSLHMSNNIIIKENILKN